MQDPSRQRVELIVQQLDQLPTLPAVAMRVLEATADQSTTVKQVTELIESDPALATRILQLVHRADMGVRGEVTSLDRAVLLLGFETVRHAVLAVSVFATFAASPAEGNSKFNRDEFWKHSIAVGCCAELLAQTMKEVWGKDCGVEPSEAFTAGLIHDLGKIALDVALPKSYGRVVEAADLMRGNIADVERNVIGIDHCVAGKRLAERWDLPASLRDCIWLHGQLPQALPDSVRNARLVNLISLADLIVRRLHIGYSGNYLQLSSESTLRESLSLLPEQVEEVTKKLIDSLEARARVLGLGDAAAGDLYRQALQQANRELAKVTDQLAAKNRRLMIRSKYFEALSAFQSELRPDAPPSVVMQAIGHTAAGVVDSAVVAVFSLPPGRHYADVTLVERGGNVVGTLIVDFTSPVLDELNLPNVPAALGIPTTRNSDGPVRTVGPELEWLIQGFSPRLGGVQRHWICLEADGACVGGVLWGAADGEAQRLSPQIEELTALGTGWSLALRTTQIRDESKALSEQLADANRRLQSVQSEVVRNRMLTTVAEMAAGAAHEMNNPLAVISGRSQLLASTLSDPRDIASAQLIYERSQQLSNMITELMHFAKPQTAHAMETGLSTLIDIALEQVRSRADMGNRQIDIRPWNVPSLTVDPQQVGMALSEILLNALQATDAARGCVSIDARFDGFSQQVVVTITDNGSGMDEHVLRHAFDPFFSAKSAGRRPGMGLSKAVRWVEGSGGSIRLESRPGEGTRAIVILPAAMPNFAPADPGVEQKGAG